MVESLRAKIEARGGEYRFQQRVTDIEIETAPSGERRVLAPSHDQNARIAWTIGTQAVRPAV